jgi:hypothetical protein
MSNGGSRYRQRCAPRTAAKSYDEATVSRSKKQFKERSRAGQLAILALSFAAASLVAGAERDLQRRPAEDVRGSKTLWRVLCLNAIGAAVYFRWGRRTARRLASVRGAWRGRVRMADDFDELPEDIAAAFGAR